jgi:hypothetical protein
MLRKIQDMTPFAFVLLAVPRVTVVNRFLEQGRIVRVSHAFFHLVYGVGELISYHAL